MLKLKSYTEARCGAELPELRAGDLVVQHLRSLSADCQTDFDTEIERILSMGCERLNMESALLARIADGHLEVVQGHGRGCTFKVGERIPLEHTFCDLSCQADAPIGIDNVSGSELRSHPAHTLYGIEAYLGTPVNLAADLWGSVCFFRRQPWSQQILDSDIDFVELLGAWVESALHCRFTATRLSELAVQVEALSEYDPLTGVLGRETMRRRLRELDANDHAGVGLTAMLVDIDNIQAINADYGHEAGDQLIKHVAAEFQLSLRPVDMVARIGGDKFLIILPGVTTLAGAEAAARIQRSLAKSNPPVGLLGCTVSVGICAVEHAGDDILEQVITTASALLAESKQQGKNRITCASSVSC